MRLAKTLMVSLDFFKSGIKQGNVRGLSGVAQRTGWMSQILTTESETPSGWESFCKQHRTYAIFSNCSKIFVGSTVWCRLRSEAYWAEVHNFPSYKGFYLLIILDQCQNEKNSQVYLVMGSLFVHRSGFRQTESIWRLSTSPLSICGQAKYQPVIYVTCDVFKMYR